MPFVIILLVFIIIGGLLGIVYVINYNKMQYLNTKKEHSLKIIEDILKERSNLIEESSDIIKKNVDKDYLKEYIDIKNKNLTVFDRDKKITEAIELINTLKSDNNKLNDNKEINEISKVLRETDEKLSATKNYFNKSTKDLNSLVNKFPSSLIAKIHKYKLSQLFEVKDITKYDIK